MKTYDNVSDAGEIKSLSEQRVRPCRCVLPTGLCKENSKEGGCLAKQEAAARPGSLELPTKRQQDMCWSRLLTWLCVSRKVFTVVSIYSCAAKIQCLCFTASSFEFD